MPEVFRKNGYRFFFYSNDHDPSHVHVESGDDYAVIDINSLTFIDEGSLSNRQKREVIELVRQNQQLCKDKWNEHFGKS